MDGVASGVIFLVCDSRVGRPGSGGMASFNWEGEARTLLVEDC